jgi:hypothetical protein
MRQRRRLMNKMDKDICKAMIRQAMEDYKTYNTRKYASYSEKVLLLHGMVAVLDYLPLEHYRRFEMTNFIDRTMSRLLGV